MITWGISARMQPLPDDPQQRQTAKMMRWMPMMFGLILYNYASGLTIYMTCSALWSICEVILGIYFTLITGIAFYHGNVVAGIFLSLFMTGFIWIGLASLIPGKTMKKPVPHTVHSQAKA